MTTVPASKLFELQGVTHRIHNMSIVAHVDHGKTTLADSLISSNGIFSVRNAGQIRYMDYLPEEQARGITMKSAAISLLHKHNGEEHLINLIDSPGHVDFTAEVSAALRLTDGAVVVLDAVEGVCIQTRVVLRQAWSERVRPILFINKIDKLFTHLEMDAEKAFEHIDKLITSINEVAATLELEHHFMNQAETVNDNDVSFADDESDVSLSGDGEWFSPAKGNVVFGSALNGWAFRTNDFVSLYSKKLGMKENVLKQVLWGNYYLDPKTKLIYRKKPRPNSSPIFANLILKPIWSVWQALIPTRQEEQLTKIITSLNLKINPRELKDTNTPQTVASSVLRAWLPLSHALLEAVVEQLPSPLEAQPLRLNRLLPRVEFTESVEVSPDSFVAPSEWQAEHDAMRASVSACNISPEAPVIAFISKVFSVAHDQLRTVSRPGVKTVEEEQPEGNLSFIGLGRLFSGELRPGQTLYVLGPKYHPSKPQKHVAKVTVTKLFLCMGRSYEAASSIPAGAIFGMSGLEGVVLKSATLSSTLSTSGFDGVQRVASPIVRVAVEPVNAHELSQLREGLRLLNIAEVGTEVYIQKSGEHIVAATGELHLKYVLGELENRFARIPLRVSEPLVSFRETITSELSKMRLVDGEVVMTNPADKGDIVTTTADSSIKIHVKVAPIPLSIIRFLNDHQDSTAHLMKSLRLLGTQLAPADEEYKLELERVFSEAGPEWQRIFSRLWMFGPNHCGSNLLVNEYSQDWQFGGPLNGSERVAIPHESSILSGFSLAIEAGPMCLEPIMGVCFIVLSVEEEPGLVSEGGDSQANLSSYGPRSGQVISAMKEACRESFLRHSLRLMQPMYQCSIQVFNSENLGRVYSVLAKRHAHIMKEDWKEGSDIYDVNAHIPVASSFGLAEELFTVRGLIYERSLHSNSIFESANETGLTFRTPQALRMLSFLTPTGKFLTKILISFPPQEELLVDGYNYANVGTNLARSYIESVRKRKGLPTLEKRVDSANKQRTLARKK